MRWHWWYVPLYLWALPNTLIGVLVALWSRPVAWHWSGGCIEVVTERIPNRPTAMTWGWLLLYDSETSRVLKHVRIHERVHVVQSLIGGVFFMLAYLACFLWLYVDRRGWYDAYMANPFERQAYDATIGDIEPLWGYRLDDR